MVISYGKQSVDKSDKLTVLKSFNQLNLTSGKYLNLFEKKLKISFEIYEIIEIDTIKKLIDLTRKKIG